MSDITLNQITSGYNIGKINNNFDTIEDAVNNGVLHLVGGNNVMLQDLDMNSKNILNGNDIYAKRIYLNGVLLVPGSGGGGGSTTVITWGEIGGSILNQSDLQSAISGETTQRINGDGALSSRIDVVSATAGANTAAINTEKTARASGDAANAASITSVQASLNAVAGTVDANSTAVNTLSARVTNVEGSVNSNSQAITSLQATIANADNVGATAQSVIDLSARVTVNEGNIASNSQSITTLQSAVDTLQGDNGGSTAISDLSTRVTAVEGTVTSQGNAITTLNSNVGTNTSGIASNSTAINSLTTRANNVDGTLSSQATQLSSLSSAVGANAADISTEKTARASGDSANATSINNLSTTVSGHTATINSFQSSIDGINAKAGVTIDVNGYMTGWALNNNGSSGAFNVRADKFSVTSPTGGDSLTWSGGSLVAKSGSYMKVTGPGFGVGSEFVEWYGPAMAVTACSRSNAIYYLTKTGAAYFGGSLSAGVIKNGAVSTQYSTTASVETGIFATNGGLKTVVVSFSYADGGTLPGNSVSTYRNRATSVLVTLQRSYNGGAWTTINSFTATGTTTADYDTEFAETIININCGGSITMTDSTAGTGTFNYKATLSNASNWPITFAGHQGQQRLSIVSTE